VRNVKVLALLYDSPVLLEIIRLDLVLLLDEGAGAVQFAVDGLNCNLGAVILEGVSYITWNVERMS
jgi:hypothetical protein